MVSMNIAKAFSMSTKVHMHSFGIGCVAVWLDQYGLGLSLAIVQDT